MKKNNVVDFVIKPATIKSPYQYLEKCKTVLIEEDYEDILCGIMDKTYYEKLETELKDIVDTYFSYIY